MENNNPEELHALPDDDSFLQWIADSAPQETADLKNIRYLKTILTKLTVREPLLSAEDKTILWNNIRQAIGEDREKKPPSTIARILVAAFLIGLLGGVYAYFTRNKLHEVDYMSMIDSACVARSENICLILAGNKIIDIPKDSPDVVYDPAGKVKIDRKTIEPTGKEPSSTLHQLIVPYGKTTSLTLSDGTKIRVNSGTRLIYPSVFGKDRREIFCTGEIYLDVAEKEHCPFIVKTGYMEIKVKGTRFNVSAYKDEPTHSVVLLSGAVSIKGRRPDAAYEIHPNQMLSYETESKNAGILDVDADRYVSWIHGYLYLQGEAIDRVLQKLEKHFNVSFTYTGEGFERIFVRGKLDLSGSVENALDYICLTTSIRYTTHNKSIEIINK
jgi:hypothetical protein